MFMAVFVTTIRLLNTAENISELVDESRDARVPPLILLDISPEKVEQSPKKRKVLHLSEGSTSSPNNNNVIDSSVLESTVHNGCAGDHERTQMFK